MNGKELSGSIVPDQARFGPEFFLMQTLPDYKSKIVLHLPAKKQRDRPRLFPLMEQCFQEVGLTEWLNVISARCPENEDIRQSRQMPVRLSQGTYRVSEHRQSVDPLVPYCLKAGAHAHG